MTTTAAIEGAAPVDTELVTPAAPPLVSLFDEAPVAPDGESPAPAKEAPPIGDEPKKDGADPEKPKDDAVVKPEDAVEIKPKADITPAEPAKPAVDWEARYRDTANYATRVNQQNKELARQLDLINKKLDGTYDPEQEKPVAPSPDELVSEAKLEGKVSASQTMAEERYGKDAVQKLILDEQSPYARLEAADPTVWPRVMASNAPMLEAMAVLKEHVFFSQYGRDPDAIKKAITKEVLDAERETLRAEVTKDVMARIAQKGEQVVGLAGVRGASGVSEKPRTPTGSLVKGVFG